MKQRKELTDAKQRYEMGVIRIISPRVKLGGKSLYQELAFVKEVVEKSRSGGSSFHQSIIAPGRDSAKMVSSFRQGKTSWVILLKVKLLESKKRITLSTDLVEIYLTPTQVRTHMAMRRQREQKNI